MAKRRSVRAATSSRRRVRTGARPRARGASADLRSFVERAERAAREWMGGPSASPFVGPLVEYKERFGPKLVAEHLRPEHVHGLIETLNGVHDLVEHSRAGEHTHHSSLIELKPWTDFPIDFLAHGELRVFGPSRQSPIDATKFYSLEATYQDSATPQGQLPSRYFQASASKLNGTFSSFNSVTGRDGRSEAAIGLLYQPPFTGGDIEFRPLVQWSVHGHALTTRPPTAVRPPDPAARAVSDGLVVLMAMSWPASGGGFQRLEHVRNLPLFHHGIVTPYPSDDFNAEGTASPESPNGWLKVTADADRVYAFWALLKVDCKSNLGFQQVVQGPDQLVLASSVASVAGSIPYAVVEYKP